MPARAFVKRIKKIQVASYAKPAGLPSGKRALRRNGMGVVSLVAINGRGAKARSLRANSSGTIGNATDEALMKAAWRIKKSRGTGMTDSLVLAYQGDAAYYRTLGNLSPGMQSVVDGNARFGGFTKGGATIPAPGRPGSVTQLFASGKKARGEASGSRHRAVAAKVARRISTTRASLANDPELLGYYEAIRAPKRKARGDAARSTRTTKQGASMAKRKTSRKGKGHRKSKGSSRKAGPVVQRSCRCSAAAPRRWATRRAGSRSS